MKRRRRGQWVRLAVVAVGMLALAGMSYAPAPDPDPEQLTRPVPMICRWYPGRETLTTSTGKTIDMHCPRWWVELSRTWPADTVTAP